MRTALCTLALVFGVLMIPASRTSSPSWTDVTIAAAAVPSVALDNQQPPAPPQINVEINKGGGRVWYMNPVWMAIGGIALVLVILLIVLAARGGGGTTVVRG